jgi:hypothetical protein
VKKNVKRKGEKNVFFLLFFENCGFRGGAMALRMTVTGYRLPVTGFYINRIAPIIIGRNPNDRETVNRHPITGNQPAIA